MKDENLKTLVNIIGVLLIVFNVIVLMPIFLLLYPSLSNKAFEVFRSPDIAMYSITSALFITSGVGLIKKREWAASLLLAANTLLLVFSYFISDFSYLILGIFMIGLSIYIFRKRKDISALKYKQKDSIIQLKNWNISKRKFIFLYILSNLLTWGTLAIYIIYGLMTEGFPGEALLIAMAFISIAFTSIILVNAILLTSYKQRNKKFFYTSSIVFIILGLLFTIVPILIKLLEGGSLYPN